MNERKVNINKNFLLGFIFSFIACVIWGILPVALKGLTPYIGIFTIMWWRFFISLIFIFFFLGINNKFVFVYKLKSPLLIVLILICVSCFFLNNFFFIFGINYIQPTTAQVLMQLAPYFLLIGGIFIYKERFNVYQWVGCIILTFGVVIFFFKNICVPNSILYPHFFIGVIFIVFSAVSWGGYALVQKNLLTQFSVSEILFFIFFVGFCVFLPNINMIKIASLDWFQMELLLFTTLSLFFSFYCFTKSLQYWEQIYTAIIVSTQPIITLFVVEVLHYFAIKSISLRSLNIFNRYGIFIVVAGSLFTIWSGKFTPKRKKHSILSKD